MFSPLAAFEGSKIIVPSRRRLVGAVRNSGANHTLFIEPKRIKREEARPTDVGRFLLVIQHPQFFVGTFHDAMMAGTDDVAATTHDGIAGIF